jgi:hypothetical protein
MSWFSAIAQKLGMTHPGILAAYQQAQKPAMGQGPMPAMGQGLTPGSPTAPRMAPTRGGGAGGAVVRPLSSLLQTGQGGVQLPAMGQGPMPAMGQGPIPNQVGAAGQAPNPEYQVGTPPPQDPAYEALWNSQPRYPGAMNTTGVDWNRRSVPADPAAYQKWQQEVQGPWYQQHANDPAWNMGGSSGTLGGGPGYPTNGVFGSGAGSIADAIARMGLDDPTRAHAEVGQPVSMNDDPTRAWSVAGDGHLYSRYPDPNTQNPMRMYDGSLPDPEKDAATKAAYAAQAPPIPADYTPPQFETIGAHPQDRGGDNYDFYNRTGKYASQPGQPLLASGMPMSGSTAPLSGLVARPAVMPQMSTQPGGAGGAALTPYMARPAVMPQMATQGGGAAAAALQRMRAPNGQHYMIPSHQVGAAQAAGGELV